MKKFNKGANILSVLLIIGFIGLITIIATIGFRNIEPKGQSLSALAVAADLSSSADFAVLAGAAVSDAGSSVISGDVGLSPTGGTAITGLSCSQVTGTIYDTNGGYTGGFDSDVTCLSTNAGLLTTAKSDLSLAYNDAVGQASDFSVTASTTDSFAAFPGYILSPGVYTSTSSMGVPIALILDGGGDPNAVFIFQADSTLNTVSGSTITLSGEAQACNVFWQVGSSATLGTTTDFSGNIMAAVSITDDSGSTVLGRLLADADDTDADSTGAVTLNDTTVTVPTCASPNITLVKTITNDNGGTAATTDWTLEATGPTLISGATGSGAVTNAVVTAGTYTLTETGGPTGYTGSTYSCVKNGGAPVVSNSIILAGSDDAICTINNDDIAPSLTLDKIVVNNNSGTAVESDWTLTATGPTPISGPGAAPSTDVASGATFSVGAYTLSESTGPSGYTASDWSCVKNAGAPVIGASITLDLGDVVTCTITNDDNAVAPSGGGGGSSSGSSPKPVTLNDDIAPEVIPIVPSLPNTGPGLPNTGFPPR